MVLMLSTVLNSENSRSKRSWLAVHTSIPARDREGDLHGQLFFEDSLKSLSCGEIAILENSKVKMQEQ